MVRFSLFTLALVAAAPLAAQTVAAPQAPAGPTSVTRAQVTANAEAEFARVDANKDGQMSRAEIENYQRISATARITARNKALFAELDADKNGQISAAEFAKASPVPKPDATYVLRINANKDGQVSLAEHRGAALETFVKIDTNKDGTLTAAEVRALQQARRSSVLARRAPLGASAQRRSARRARR